MIPGQLEALFSFLLTVGLVLPGQSYNVVSRSTFSRVQNSAKHSENTPWAHRMAMCACVDPHTCMRWSADFSKKRVFRGEKGHGPGQSKDLETRIKTPTIQCKNLLTGILNFEWKNHCIVFAVEPPKTQYSAKILRREFRTSSGAQQLRG